MLWKLLICLLLFGISAVETDAQTLGIFGYRSDGIEPQLTDECGAGIPLPDGTIIEIRWDQDNDGPDADDDLYPVGPGFLQANFNQFEMNGAELLAAPGGFYAESGFVVNYGIPSPSRYWLRICVPNADRYWRSDVFVLHGGYEEVNFGQAPGNIPMVCVEAACTGCVPPPAPTGLSATTNLCQRVDLAWTAYTADPTVDSILVRRNGIVIGVVAPAVTSFTDVEINTGGQTPFDIVARKIDGTDTCYSLPNSANGNYRRVPLTPLNVAATDNLCDVVAVTWTNPFSVLSMDSIGVFENGIEVMRVARGTANQQRSANIPATSGDVKTYAVAGWNATCEFGAPSPSTAGGAQISPATPTNVTASDTSCAGIFVSWQAVPGVVDFYRVYRDGNLLMTVNGQTTSIFDAPATAQSHGFSVRAISGDCISELSAVENGHRILTEPVDEIAASDDLIDRVVVSWANVAGDVTYTIFRDDEALANVPQGTTTYEDFGGVLETEYTYGVEVYSTCDTGFVAITDNGMRTCGKPAPPVLTIATDGNDAVLSWTEVDTTMNGCEADPSVYVLYFSEISDGAYYFLAAVAGTSYRHLGVVPFTTMRFYRAESYVGNPATLLSLPTTGRFTREDVTRILARELQRR
jgi:hypothetical protein